MRVTLRTNGVVFAFVYLTIGETPEMTRILKMPHPKKIYSVVFFFFLFCIYKSYIILL